MQRRSTIHRTGSTYEFAERFRPDNVKHEPIDVDPGFRDGRLLAVSNCKRADTKKQHMAYYTPEQIREGNLPCSKCK
jgi:hypothetical protein